MKNRYLTAVLVSSAAIGCVFYPVSPGAALVLGFLMAGLELEGLSSGTVQRLSKLLLAWAIVGFGLTVTLSTIAALTTQYFWLTASGIGITLAVSWILGRILGVDAELCALIGSGTAICGASAIASVGSAVKSSSEKLSMALGVVLVLNAVALVLFPKLGHLMGLSNGDFSVWAGLAIHDTSSVLGAALAYDPGTVEIATTVKLARAIWIAPVTALFTKVFSKDSSSVRFKLPWFIWGYLLAALFAGLLAPPAGFIDTMGDGARRAFRAGLFLTGCAINIRSLASLGFRPFLLGVVIWAMSALWSLSLILL